jgi:hypothetical protein
MDRVACGVWRGGSNGVWQCGDNGCMWRVACGMWRGMSSACGSNERVMASWRMCRHVAWRSNVACNVACGEMWHVRAACIIAKRRGECGVASAAWRM